LSNKIHIPIIDVLRGFAALSVCLFHYVCTTTGYIHNELILQIFDFGSRGVQVFFIISGMVIPLSMITLGYKYAAFKVFILKRFIRIEPPYLVSVAIGVIYLYSRNFLLPAGTVDITPSFRDILLHLGYLIPFVDGAKWVNTVYWTLSVEFQYYLYLALIFPLVLNNKLVLRLLFYSLLLLPPFFVESEAFFFHWSAFFLLGIVYILWLTTKINKLEYFIITGLCMVSLAINNELIDLIVGVLTVAAIHFFKNFTFNYGKRLGNISYSLYLLHTLIGGAFVNVMSHKFTLPYQKFIVIFLGVLISLASAAIFYRFIEKPSQQYTKKIK
jgi:peptidoglycan/LPS O-acetylase OafA/YrhL